MAVGDDAAAAGYPLVPASDLRKNAPTEFNRTRDFIAQVKAMIPAVWPISKGGTGATTAATARVNLGIPGSITISTATPSNAQGVDGDIWLKYTA